jgi:transcriptional regulator with XRE-family HTH domain
MPRHPIDASLLQPLGKAIRMERGRLGLSCADLAELTKGHYKDNTLRGIESGGNTPSQLGLQRLCEALPAIADDLVLLHKNDTVDTYRGTNRSRPALVDATRLTGQWYAFWQTMRYRSPASIVEPVEISSKGKPRFEMNSQDGGSWLEVALAEGEPPPSHIHWRAQCEISGEVWVTGRFHSLGDQRIDGVFRLKLINQSDIMAGHWMGCCYDSEQIYATLVVGRSRQRAQACFEEACQHQPTLPLTPLPRP